MNGDFWPYTEKVFSGKWLIGVLAWFFSHGRWILPLAILFVMEQFGWRLW